MTLFDTGSSGENGKYGIDWFDVTTITDIFKTLQHTFITKSPMSRSNTPCSRNARAFWATSSVVPEMKLDASEPSFSNSLTNSCLKWKVALSSSCGS